MKRVFMTFLLILLMISTVLTSCDIDKILGAIDEETELPLEAPTNLRVDKSNATLYWNSVEYAIGYTVKIDASTYTTDTNSFSLQGLPSGEYTISVKANGDGIRWISSEYSDTIQYIRKADTGNKYEDNVIAAFREFDEINTKSSYLGYGIDIINANAINSKNVLMNYPIFDMEKLLDEQLLKSNEHYNSFQSIGAKTIEEFTINMGTSTSVSSGTSVSASGNIKGVDVSASASLTNGLTSTFTKTSEMVESQYFLEIISENQSYWLILQSSEQEYKELLSDEFKADLYSDMEPALLFQKYGTHMLTSVAMGGSIHMYYTMYSYEKGDKTHSYTEISSQLKTEVEAAYGGYSAGVGTENSFETSFTYDTLCKKYNIQIDECIYAAGGGSYGINSKHTLYDNYYDWQKSLDTNPVVIGIKDINSLYPIWNLLDMSVEGAEERYAELYEYFQTYGKGSYDNLLQTFDITPAVDPTDITDIKVGVHEDYSENQVINVRPGERLQISYDVVPDNATKYIKTYSVENTELATIDENGLLVINSDAPSGSYVRVNITAGSVIKTITLYVVNAYNVNFNTRVANLEVAPIYGILEGYTIDEPNLYREGYVLEGWYTDVKNTNRFDFENDSVTSHMTLYANWVPIKPVVTFDVGDGSKVDSQTLAYNATVTKPKNPTLSGYIFDGWFVDEECTEKFDFTTTVINDITLYAKWIRIEFTVTFVTNGGTPVADASTSILDRYKIKEPTTVKQYYTLGGWYKDVDLTQKFYFESEITENTTLYAKWIPVQSTVVLVDTDGVSPVYDELGFVIPSCNTDINRNFTISPPTPCKEGHTFVGWYLNGKLVDLSTYSQFTPREGEYILVAKWAKIEYTVTFVTNGGTPVADAGTSILDRYKIKEPTTVKQYYTLGGWYKDVDLTQKFYFESEITENTTLYAKWIPVQSTVVLVDTDGVSPVYDELGFVIPSCNTDINRNFTISPPTPCKEGHTFVGWYLNGKLVDLSTYSQFTPRESEYILVAKWNVNSYNVIYTIDGVEYDTTSYKFGDKIIYPEVDVEGHTFSGWKCNGDEELPLTMPADNIKIEGSLEVDTYTIEYYVDEKLYTREMYTFGEPIVMIDEPSKDGKTFSGWICSTMYHFPSTMPACDLRIDGSFDQVIFQVNYYIDDVLVKTDNVFKGHGIIPFVPTKEGYTFSGWFVKTSAGIILMPNVMPENDIDVYGTFSINSYTITFDTDGGSEIPSITTDYGTTITNPKNPTREGYTFAGWDVAIPDTMPAEDLTITAKWNINHYTITFDTDDGSEIPSITADYGTTITNPENPTREGYTFAGWDVAIPDTMPAEDLTITAKWNINHYTITFDTDGGSEIPSITTDYGTTITNPKNPTREGYTFAGWDVAIPDTMPAEDLTITAKWNINHYTITFDTDDGSEIPSITADYGTTITNPENPTREGYTFAGWDVEIPDTMPAEDLTITAKWNINHYTITFDTDGGSEILSITADYGTRITNPENPTREGYTFAGWDVEIPDTMPAKDMLITAKWDLIEFIIDYDLSNMITVDNQNIIGEVEMVDAVIGEDIKVLSYHKKPLNTAKSSTYTEYYNFLGWFTADGVQITNEQGTLLEYVPGYIENGRWIYRGTGETKQSIKLYAKWKQEHSDYEYIYDPDSLCNIVGDGHYYIIDNIDMADRDWTPIPNFSGEINGDGHTIDHFTFTYSNTGTSSANYGFCEVLSGSGTITNVKFNNAYIDITVKKDGKENIYVGVVCGTVNGGTISNVEIIGESKITGLHFREVDEKIVKIKLGAIAGRIIDGEITDCKVEDCTLFGKVDMGERDGTGYSNVGGIVGEITSCGEVRRCNVNNCSITSIARGTASNNFFGLGDQACLYTKAAGIAGYMADSGKISDCHTKGNTLKSDNEKVGTDGLDSSSSEREGAICARADKGTEITNCTYTENYPCYDGGSPTTNNNSKG